MVTSVAAAGILPTAMPPRRAKSEDFRASFPIPMQISRDTFRPAGATMSRTVPLLPANRSARLTRANRSRADPSARRVASPRRCPSSENIMRTPFDGSARGPNPSLMAPGMSDLFGWDLGGDSDAPLPHQPGHVQKATMPDFQSIVL